MESTQQSKHAVRILLAVWGKKFIDEFLQLSLPSLLAPGNIPALAKAHPTCFMFLTRSNDVDYFSNHPVIQQLRNVVNIEFMSINDLIIFGNYSTTLTLAYHRAMQEAGTAMLNTYFIFLPSDYIMADGSLSGLLRYINKGYSGICAGNFQVLKNSMEPFLRQRIDPDTNILSIKPRELLQKSFQCLHPITLASSLTQNAIHNYRANRFFFYPNQQVMGGRFYLLHMLCIKPEVTDYHIGGACDYSFIPTMCPSGNIAIINDSDDYLVVEMQEKQHELDNIHWGPYCIKTLTTALKEWTTQQHRDNAKHTIYFHTIDINPTIKEITEKNLEQFINSISTKLQKHTAQPFNNHAYWFKSVTAYEKKQPQQHDYDYTDVTELTTSRAKKWFQRCYGTPPNVLRWHHRWREYRAIRQILKQAVHAANNNRTLVLYGAHQKLFMHYFNWLKSTLGVQHHYFAPILAQSAEKIQSLQNGEFNLCVIFTELNHLEDLQTTLEILHPMLAQHSKILLLIPNNNIQNFRKECAYQIHALINSPYRLQNIAPINNNLSLLGSSIINKITHRFDYYKKMRFFLFVLLGIPGAVYSLIRNCCVITTTPKRGYCAHMLVTLEKIPC